MAGLLDFLETPAGQGLLAATFAGLAGARRGAPMNTLGAAGLGGLAGYSNALNMNQDRQRQDIQNKMLAMQMQQLERARADEEAQQQAFKLMTQARQTKPVMGLPTYGQADEGMPSLFQGAPIGGDIGMQGKNFDIGVTPGEVTMQPNMEAMRQLQENPYYQKMAALAEMKRMFPDKVEPYTLKPGEVRFGADNKQVALVPEQPNPNKPFNPDGTPNLAFQEYEMNKAAKSAVKQTTIVNPAKDPFKNEKSLRDEYTGHPLVKSAGEMQNAFNIIQQAYNRPSAANDLAMATKYMKILDPTSVVRESEFAMAVNATGLLDKVYNYAEMIKTGKRLNPTQRKDFYDSAKAINDAFQSEASKVGNEYKAIAGQYGLNPENVTLEKLKQKGVRRYNPATRKIE